MFSRFFIDRPIFAAVVSLLISLAGILAVFNLPVGQYPEISPPAVTVLITYPGASAQVVADTVAAPIEQQMNGVPGMLYMSSNSGNDGTYTLTVTFEIGTNLNAALVMVQNRVQLALPQLPTEVQQQGITVRKRTPDILLVISFKSRRYDNIYMSNFATVSVRDELLRQEGVSDITIFGERDYSMRIWLDPQKLASRSVTGMDISAAVLAQNLAAAPGRLGQSPGGLVRGFEYPLDTLGRLVTPEQFAEMIVKAGPPRKNAAPSAAASSTTSGSSQSSTPSSSSIPGLSLAPISLSSLTTPAAPPSLTSSSSTPAVTFYTTISLAPDSSTSATTSTSLTSSLTTSGPATNAPKIASGDTASGSSASAQPASAGGAVGPSNLSGGTLDGGPDPAASIVRVRDVARTELGASSYDNGATFDAQPSVALAVRLLPGANALDVAKRVKARIAELKSRFPEGIDYEIAYDTTPFISESINDVMVTLFEAVGLVALVVLLFLQNWRAALIPMIAVPVAILGTFAVMLAIGFTINNISLFGLVLAIGIVVDDAIVVVENVERWLDQGYSPKDASYKAMEEVTGPIVAIAVVLSTVFVPCAFIGGIPGQFYRQFAVTITASTIFSAINSLTLSPALAALLMRKREESRDWLTRSLDFLLGWFFRLFNKAFERGTHAYVWIVERLIKLSAIVLIVYAGLVALTYFTFVRAPIGFVPDQDQGRLIVSVQLPDSASLNQTQDVLTQLEAIALKTPGVAHTMSAGGLSLIAGANSSNYGTVFVVLNPFDQRRQSNLSANAIMASLRKEFVKIQDADVKIFGAAPVPGLSVAGGFKIMIEDRAGLGLDELQKQTDAVVAKLRKEPSTTGVLTQFRSRTPMLYMDVDRTKATALGVNINDVNQTVQIYLGSVYVNNFNTLGRNWQVKLQAEGNFRNRNEDVGMLQVRNNRGEMVPLGTLVKLRGVNGPVSVNRYNLYTAAAISGNVPPSVSSGDAIAAVDRIAAETLPRAMSTEWTELFFLQIRTGSTAIYVFLLAVVFVFLALAALYESWALPLAVILVVPLCLLCSIGGVLITGKSVDIFVQIGLIVLVGLACKNAILIVEFAVVLRKQGKPRYEAAVEASRLRIRPILMTSLAFILGVTPLIFASGAGAEMRWSLGVAVFSGMLGVTAFGIFLTPVFFDLIQKGVDSEMFANGLKRAAGHALIGGLLGATIGYLLAKLGIGTVLRTTGIATGIGILLAVIVPIIRGSIANGRPRP